MPRDILAEAIDALRVCHTNPLSIRLSAAHARAILKRLAELDPSTLRIRAATTLNPEGRNGR